MSPESYTTPQSIEEKSRIISSTLVTAEEHAQAAAHQRRQELLPKLKADLSIQEKPSDISDLVDQRVTGKRLVFSPELLTEVLPVSKESAETTRQSRATIENIIHGADDRLMVITGPCSIHDPAATLEYAEWVTNQRNTYGDTLEIVMRFYTEKPRTVTGWKGLAYDPDLTEFLNPDQAEHDLNRGLVITRMLANTITHKGVPIAMERLNALTPQYLNGLSAYDAIGARNVLDQKAREYASGTSSPVGIKHLPDGSIGSALDAIESAMRPHTLLGNEMTGTHAEVKTSGNDSAHIILRGGKNVRNYTSEHVADTIAQIDKRGIPNRAAVIDASHDNSQKDHTKQLEVIADVARQLQMGEAAIKGVMIESNLTEGNQKAPESGSALDLTYGQSITDKCVNIATTEKMLAMLHGAVLARRAAAQL